MTTTTNTHRDRRVGEAQDWPLPTSLDDPALGLCYEQLTERWRGTGLPDGWNPEFAAEVAEATHAVISRQVGVMSSERTGWGGAANALVGLCIAERYDEGDDNEEGELLLTPFDELASIQDELRASPTAGWSTGAAGLRRLYEYSELCGPFERNGKRGRSASWQLEHDRDFEPLNKAWSSATRSQQRRARLPIPVCAAFAPPRRTISITGGGDTIELPSLWELVATVLVWGVDEARARVVEFLNEEAARVVAPRVDRPEGGRAAHGTLNATASKAHSWLLRAHEVAAAYPHLASRWQSKPQRVVLTDLEEEVETWNADRTAVPQLVYRRKRKELIQAVEQCRRRDGTLEPARSIRKLKKLVLFLLLGETSARIGEIARLSHAQFRDKLQMGGYTTAAFVITTSKRGRRIGVKEQIKAVSPETARYFRELMELCGIDKNDTDSIWMSHFAYTPEDAGSYAVENRRTGPRTRPTSLSNALVRSHNGEIEPLLPRPSGRSGFAPHSFRHLGEQLAFGVGSAWLQRHTDWETRVSAQVFSDAQLGHRMASDKLGYKDLEANRDLWALRAALGDPGAAVPGILDLLGGDAGARRGWDIDTIRGTMIRLRIAQQRVEAAGQKLAELRLQRRALRDRPLPPVPKQLDDLTSKEMQRLMLSRDLAREDRERDRDSLDDQIEQAHEERATTRSTHDRIASEVDGIRKAGRTHPILDELPTRDELQTERTTDAYPFDEETWDQALARADVQLQLLALEPEPICTRIRHHLNLAELAAVLGMTSSALRKRLRGDHQPFFALDGPDSPLLVIGDRATSKLRFIHADKLPDSFLRTLLPEQRDMIEQLLAVPMGSTRWSGRRMPPA